MATATKDEKGRLDRPAEGEVIGEPRFDIRVQTRWTWRVDRVEVSIDGGAWRECRFRGGAWWFEWTGYEEGRHAIAARVRQIDGRLYELDDRRVKVDLGRDGARRGA